MEGIRDGHAVDSCFYCALLYPELEDCPHCGKRVRYHPASMPPARSVDERWADLLEQFRAAPSPQHAQGLLELVHAHPEELEGKLASANAPNIETLRLIFEGSAPRTRGQRDEE